MGVRYVLVDDKVKQKYNLSVDYGALVLKGDNGEPAVTADLLPKKQELKKKMLFWKLMEKKLPQKIQCQK